MPDPATGPGPAAVPAAGALATPLAAPGRTARRPARPRSRAKAGLAPRPCGNGGKRSRTLFALALFAWSLAAAAPAARCQTAYLVRDLAPGDTSTPYLNPVEFFSLGDRAFFLANDSPHGPDAQSLWVSDGTPGGTQPLAAVCPRGPRGCNANRGSFYLSSARGVVFFIDDLGQLWRSDGTVAGTFQLTSRLGGGATDFAPDFVFLNGILYFVACSPTCELWRSDGTVAGTTRLAVLNLPYGPSRALVVAAGRLFFLLTPNTGVTPTVWTSDGTAAGTMPVAALAAKPAVALTAIGDRLFFVGDSYENPNQLWATGPLGADPQLLLQLGSGRDQFVGLPVAAGGLWFLADDGRGDQLWSTDGTAAGTAPVTQFPSGAAFVGVQDGLVAQLGDRLVFAAALLYGPVQLWSVSGSPATVTPLTSPAINVGTIVASGSRLVFSTTGFNSSAPATVWSTDGTVGGTVPLKVTCRAQCSPPQQRFTSFLAATGGKTFFGVVEADGFEIWSTDGTPVRTHRFGDGLMTLRARFATDVALLGGKLLYTGEGGGGDAQLWISDGTAAGTRQLTDQPAPNSSSPRGFAALGDQLFFVATSPASGAAGLWRSSGTADSTLQLASPVDGLPAVAGGSAFFLQKDAAGTEQLWSADPSGTATRQLTSFPGGQQIEANLIAYHGELLFAVAGASGCSLWRSDGTAAGTIQAIDLSGQAQHVGRLTGLEPDLYFTTVTAARDASAVWRSDGTPAGTEKLVDFSAALLDDPRFTRAGTTVFFLGLAGENTTLGLWRTDGTAAGTLALTTVPNLSDLVALNGLLYFFQGYGLLRSDGTAAGTFAIAYLEDDSAGGLPRYPSGLTAFNGRLFFSADDSAHGMELWTSDGSAAGTLLVRDLAAGLEGSMPSAFTVAGQHLYFTAHDPLHGSELWESDGTAAGTRLVQDIQPGPAGSFPGGMTPAGGLLYFAADDGLSGTELWALPLTGGAGCSAGGSALCLQGNRFKVEAAWRDFQGNGGTGQAVPLSADTGYFWFFSPGNIEIIVKVLDGRGLNGDFWVFYGALSDVEYAITVTDTQTGLTRRYVNPAGQFASTGDINAFPPAGTLRAALPQSRRAASPRPAAPPMPLPIPALPSDPQPSRERAAAGTCHAGPGRLCLNGSRFAVAVAWKDFSGNTGVGTAAPLTSDTGGFWFFDAANVELVLKVLDGRAVNGKFWVFYGALSDVQYTLTVTDTVTGAVRTYTNPSGRFASVGDTGAF
ncbi:MAG TPA: ELWxxDGT repeat protein [Thermoanaerobaculia bacterium]|nr:ELWxxDGT repeat protein [Thermoanaerobaculia bacterium]